ncbi:Ribosome maturation protein SBDS [mine drainage metagenome]|uniref:Ribosome maturation protein SBDS n=1 Tax=mine drainage metagenome TaxID=410659 RepID=T1B604_9ZZZZ
MANKSVVIKYSRNGDSFEILADADMAYEYITGKRSDPLSVLETEEIFKDAKKAERQSAEKISKAFGTTDLSKVVDIILKNGNVPITTEQRSKMVEEKRKQIIDLIATNSIDPRTGAPNPPLRIENAMKEIKVSIDPFKGASEQVESIVAKLSSILPIKFATAKIQVTIPADSASRCYGILKRFGIKSEEWLPDGSLRAVLEFPAGMQNDFFDRINKATQGRAETKSL